MYNILYKNIIIILLIINIRLLIKNNQINKDDKMNKKYIKKESQRNFYKEMLELYFQNKEKFYARGREFKMGRIGKPYTVANAISFQDKLNYLLIYESPEEKASIADKILLRNYSKKILGNDICPPILKIYNNINEINLEELPDKFVLKCNHGSGMNIFCENKLKFDLPKAKLKLKKWIDINYGIKTFEYQYLNIKKRIFAEQFLNREIINYKFSCFNGKPKFIRVKAKINGKNFYNIYYTNWTISNFEIHNKKYILTNRFKKPINLEKMIRYSKLLSSDFCYCRVDFYEENRTLFLGEITFTPFNSKFKYKDKETEIYLGNLINISKIKSKEF